MSRGPDPSTEGVAPGARRARRGAGDGRRAPGDGARLRPHHELGHLGERAGPVRGGLGRGGRARLRRLRHGPLAQQRPGPGVLAARGLQAGVPHPRVLRAGGRRRHGRRLRLRRRRPRVHHPGRVPPEVGLDGHSHRPGAAALLRALGRRRGPGRTGLRGRLDQRPHRRDRRGRGVPGRDGGREARLAVRRRRAGRWLDLRRRHGQQPDHPPRRGRHLLRLRQSGQRERAVHDALGPRLRARRRPVRGRPREPPHPAVHGGRRVPRQVRHPGRPASCSPRRGSPSTPPATSTSPTWGTRASCAGATGPT